MERLGEAIRHAAPQTTRQRTPHYLLYHVIFIISSILLERLRKRFDLITRGRGRGGGGLSMNIRVLCCAERVLDQHCYLETPGYQKIAGEIVMINLSTLGSPPHMRSLRIQIIKMSFKRLKKHKNKYFDSKRQTTFHFHEHQLNSNAV